jgi:fructose-1,6-bisphosphatase I
MLTLGEFLISTQKKHPNSTGEFIRLIHALRLASKVVSHEVNKAGIVDILGETGSTNIQGESQQKLDVMAHDLFIKALINRNIVCGIASEESEDFIKVKSTSSKGNNYVVLIDPLDGSSNIDVNVSVGTIFSIYRRKTSSDQKVTLEDFLQPGKNQVAAGYILYGTSTMLVYTTGDGVNGFTLNPAIGTFYLSHPNIKLKPKGHTYSINEANFSSFPKEIKQYLIERKEQDSQYSTRYIGSMVSDIHRNIFKGGIFLYPPNAKHPNGKLRLLYECNPISLIVEQAGGLAISMNQRILDINPKSLHQRTPFFCGNREMIEVLQKNLLI